MEVYIDAEKLLQHIPEDTPYKGALRRVLMMAEVRDDSTIKITRCKDCKYVWKEITFVNQDLLPIHYYCKRIARDMGISILPVKEEGFCYLGEEE